MCEKTFCILYFFLNLIVLSVTQDNNSTEELISNILYALQETQPRQYGLYQNVNPAISPYKEQFGLYQSNQIQTTQNLYQKPDGNQEYGFYQVNGQYGLYPSKPIKSPHKYGLHQPGGSNFFNPQQQNQQQNTLTGALQSIARYDTLQCVPRLLCEVTAGKRDYSNQYYYRKDQQQSSFLPQIDITSLLSLVNVIDLGNASPILRFGKAVLLGYTSKGNPYECTKMYPTCPRDPDRLVEYLNNHNGGFFRFFSGIRPNYQHQYGNIKIQNRILTNPTNYAETFAYDNNFHDSHKIVFSDSDQREEGFVKNIRNLRFPTENTDSNYFSVHNYQNPYKKGKGIEFSGENQYYVPDISQIKMVFPDRTGTGELILDSNNFATNPQAQVIRFYNHESDNLRHLNKVNSNFKFPNNVENVVYNGYFVIK